MSSIELNAEDTQVLQDYSLTAEDIGKETVHDLFQSVFFSNNNNNNNNESDNNNTIDNDDDRDIDSQGNSKSPERHDALHQDQTNNNSNNDMDEDELAALLGDDDEAEVNNGDAAETDRQSKKADKLSKREKKNRHVEDAVDEALAGGGEEEDDQEEAGDVFDWDKISENEEQERDLEQFDDEDDDFKAWIRSGEDDTAREEQDENEDDEEAGTKRVPQTLAAARAALVQASMSKMGATESDEKIVRNAWPERLKELEISEGRPGLRGSTLPDGSVVELSRDGEALWILKILVQPGYAFERRAHVVQEVVQSNNWKMHPLIVSIKYALDCFIEEQLEPAYLMLYRQSKFGPLVQELLRCDAASASAPDAWFAYCANTGRRQTVKVEYMAGRFPVASTLLRTARGTSVGTGYEGFKDFDVPGQPVIRRPAFIPLGRLLTDILFLDSLCNRLERHRHITLDILTQMNNSAAAASYQQQQNQSLMTIGPNGGLQHQNWFAPSQTDLEHLANITFDSPHSSDVWSEYAEFFHRMQLAYSHLLSTATSEGQFGSDDANAAGMAWARSPSCRLILLGIAQHFQEYALPGPYLHENVVTGTASHISANRRESRFPDDWAEDISRTMDSENRLSNKTLLACFNDALVEQLSVLPFVREAAMTVFISEGRCEIVPSYRSSEQQLRVVPIQSLLSRDPTFFLELLEDEAGGSCIINFNVELNAIERVLPVNALLQGCGIPVTGEIASKALLEWQHQILRCREPAARRLQNVLRSHVRVMLIEAATRAVTKRCAGNLGNLLAEGPYEPSTVRVNKERRVDVFDQLPRNNEADEPQPTRPAFSRDADPTTAALWPVAFEITEALPIRGVSTARTNQAQSHRTCGCARGPGGVTVFAFVDSFGMLKHVVRWVDTASQVQAGREVQKVQHDQLRRACRQFEPEVISVAPTGDMRQSWKLFREVQDCLARDQELENQTSGAAVLQSHIPVVFSSPVVAKLMANATAIVEEFPRSDPTLRVTVSLARHTQDPLRSICALFDNSENGGFVGRLPIGCEMFREAVLPRSQLYKKLEWEMALWVAASGVDATALLGLPPLFAERQLQFVPGFGRRKAARLMQVLRNIPSRLLSRRELAVILLKEFGGGSALPTDISVPSADAQLFGAEAAESFASSMNATVINASPCLRVRANESSAHYHASAKNKISENLSFLYPDLAGGKKRAQDEDNDEDDDGFLENQDDAQYNNNNNGKITINTLLPGGEEDNLAHHLFDETLIPLEWYSIATAVCRRAFGNQQNNVLPSSEYAVAMAKLSSLRQRHRALAESFSGSSAENFALQATQDVRNKNNASFFGSNEVDFIIDELISFGAVRSRRTYRKMTDARYFALVTGHTFVESRKNVASDRKHQSAVLCLGDIMEGVPESITISNRSEQEQFTLRLQGSKGLTLMMRVEELPAELSGPIRDAIRQVQNVANLRGRARPPQNAPVPFAMKTMTIYGRLQLVDLATGEARVSYESNPASVIGAVAYNASANQRLVDGALLHGGIVGGGGALDSSRSRESNVASIKSTQLILPSRGNALRAASHVLYRNVSNETAKNLLQNADIGEVILRPCSDRKAGDVIVVVKAGGDRESITNIPVFEERKSSGVTYYRLVDPLTASTTKSIEFMEIDHLLERFVRPMARRYRELSDHRRFASSREQVREQFDEQLAQVPRAFVYNILEVPNHARCSYSIVYRSGANTRDRELKLCATGGQLLMQNPAATNNSNINDFWIRCDDAEQMTMKLKKIVCGGK